MQSERNGEISDLKEIGNIIFLPRNSTTLGKVQSSQSFARTPAQRLQQIRSTFTQSIEIGFQSTADWLVKKVQLKKRITLTDCLPEVSSDAVQYSAVQYCTTI